MLSEKRLHVLLQHFCSSNSTASSVVWQRAMVEIYERTTVTLSYAGAPNVPIPATLLVQGSDGSKYLKVRPSNYAICKLICGDAKCKAVKNPSLRSSPALAELQSRMQKALEAFETAEGEDIFEAEASAGLETAGSRDFDPASERQRCCLSDTQLCEDHRLDREDGAHDDSGSF